MIRDFLQLYYQHHTAFVVGGIASGGLLGSLLAIAEWRADPEGASWVGRFHHTLLYVASGAGIGACVWGTLPSTIPCLTIYWLLNLLVNGYRRGRC
jgi:hypothetical protein